METNPYLLIVPLTEQAGCSLSIASCAQNLFSGRSSLVVRFGCLLALVCHFAQSSCRPTKCRPFCFSGCQSDIAHAPVRRSTGDVYPHRPVVRERVDSVFWLFSHNLNRLSEQVGAEQCRSAPCLSSVVRKETRDRKESNLHLGITALPVLGREALCWGRATITPLSHVKICYCEQVGVGNGFAAPSLWRSLINSKPHFPSLRIFRCPFLSLNKGRCLSLFTTDIPTPNNLTQNPPS